MALHMFPSSYPYPLFLPTPTFSKLICFSPFHYIFIPLSGSFILFILTPLHTLPPSLVSCHSLLAWRLVSSQTDLVSAVYSCESVHCIRENSKYWGFILSNCLENLVLDNFIVKGHPLSIYEWITPCVYYLFLQVFFLTIGHVLYVFDSPATIIHPAIIMALMRRCLPSLHNTGANPTPAILRQKLLPSGMASVFSIPNG